VVRNHWSANGKIHVIGVERLVRVAHEVLAGEHTLVIEIIRHRTMESVRTGLSSEHRLQPGSAAVFARKRIDLNTRFLDRFRLGGQIQNALTNAAGHV
jgi:hypothetical protein